MRDLLQRRQQPSPRILERHRREREAHRERGDRHRRTAVLGGASGRAPCATEPVDRHYPLVVAVPAIGATIYETRFYPLEVALTSGASVPRDAPPRDR